MAPRQGSPAPNVTSDPIENVANRPHSNAIRGDDFTYAMLSEVKAGQAAILEALKGLKEKVDGQTAKLDKIDDLRVEAARMATELSHLTRDMDDVKGKLDGVRKWVLGAAGAIALIGVLGPLLLPRIWPVPAAPVAQPPAPPPAGKPGTSPSR